MLSVIEENDDLVANGDQHYTQGLRLSFTHSPIREHPSGACGWRTSCRSSG